MVSTPAFAYLAAFAAIHVLRLNFVVSSVNAQVRQFGARGDRLVELFGWMLPFGFVSAPLTAFLLARDAILGFEAANVLGLLYGLALCWGTPASLLCVAFPVVALSRQLVYSSVFHFIGHEFGFVKYGTLLGIVNLVVAGVGCLQYPLVALAESPVFGGSYFVVNTILLVLPLPLWFVRSILHSPSSSSSCSSATAATDGYDGDDDAPAGLPAAGSGAPGEGTSLLRAATERQRHQGSSLPRSRSLSSV